MVRIISDANAVYVYDLANRLTSLTNNIPDANDTMSFDYTMDKVGNHLSKTGHDVAVRGHGYNKRLAGDMVGETDKG